MGQCDTNDIKKVGSLDPREAIEIVGGTNIKVVREELSDKVRYTINYNAFKAPTINVNTQIAKVGVTVPFIEFTGSFVPGSESIVQRTMTPDKGLDLTVPFSWTETNVRGTVPGLWPKYNGEPLELSVTDAVGTVVTKQVGVEYRHLFYMGFSDKDTLLATDIKELGTQDLLTSILSKYSSFTYTGNGVLPLYIYWAFPLGSPTFNEAAEGPLPVPLKLDLLSVDVEDSGVTIPYRIIRTAVKSTITNAKITLK